MTASAILKLQRAGFTEEQVEALAEFVENRLAIKSNPGRPRAPKSGTVHGLGCDLELALARLETSIVRAHADIVKWMACIAFAQAATILAVMRFFPGHP